MTEVLWGALLVVIPFGAVLLGLRQRETAD